MRRCVFAAAIICLFAFGGAAASLTAQQTPDRQTFRSGRDVLTIEVAVRSADGKPLTDLLASEFSVRVDGQLRSVVGAQLFGSQQGSAAPPAATVSAATRNTDRVPGRVVVIAVDRMSIRGGGERGAVDAAAHLVETLTPSDAVAAIGIPGAVTDLTRDHAVVLDAIRHITGTAVAIPMSTPMSWEDAVRYEQECDHIGQKPAWCSSHSTTDVKQMLIVGRAQAVTTVTNVESVLDKLEAVRAPKSLVLLSGGIPFDQTLVQRYRDLAQRAARSHTSLFIVHLDQQSADASTMGAGPMASFGSGARASDFYGGRDYETGLATIASMTGGEFFLGVGSAQGSFNRIASELTWFYELGVESTAADADGKTHRIDVAVARPGAKVRAPAATAVPARKARTPVDTLKSALAEPTDVTDLPLEVATYVTHSTDPNKVRVIVSAAAPDTAQGAPSLWGSTVMDGNKVVGAVGANVDPGAPSPWASTGTVEIVPGKYRLRTAIVNGDRVGTLELPLPAGLRAMGDARASDLIVGTIENGRLEPRPRVGATDKVVAILELSADKPLDALTGTLLLAPAGSDTPVLRQALTFRARSDDKGIVLGEGHLDLTSLTPGWYVASAIIQVGGKTIGRVSRAVDVTR